MKVVTSAQMRDLEAAAFAAGATPEGLMDTAGRGVALAVARKLGGAAAQRIVVLVGPGNNGGDGLVAARHLSDMGAEVRLFLLAPRTDEDANFKAVRERDIDVALLDESSADDELGLAVAHADAVIDAVLGIGRTRPLEGVFATALDSLKRRRGLLLAVDVPSGLDTDTGAVDPHSAPADATLTFGYSKLGLHLLPGASYAGQIEVLDIGLDPALGESLDTEVMTAEWVRAALPERPLVSNKGTFGRVMVVAGSQSYTGAATLCCLGALRAGAGLVTLAALPDVRAAAAAQLPEVTYVVLPEESDGTPATDAADAVIRALSGYDVLLIGPGLGMSEGAQALVRGLLASPALADTPAVIDADALNTLARQRDWPDRLTPHAALTPHPGELARLAHSSVREVQSRRLDAAREYAAAWRQTLVLKGAETAVAAPDGRVLLSPFANPALATAGTGDVLAGAIAGLVAQGLQPFEAAGVGAYLHAAAAELYTADYGASGLLASEVAPGIAKAAAKLRRGD